MKIGWIGLGNMGTPMALNLIKSGQDVIVYNRTFEKTKLLHEEGAQVAKSLEEITNKCDIVFTMLSDDAAVKEVYLESNGILNLGFKNKIAVDMSTISPNTSKLIASECEKNKIKFLDAPVSGSVEPARKAQLLILVGGSEKVFEDVKFLFEKLGKKIMYMGSNGKGSAAKLSINLLLGLNIQGIAETVLFAMSNGIKAEDMMDIINDSAVGTGISKFKTPAIINNDFTVAAKMALYAKDLRLANEMGLNTPLIKSLYNSFQSAIKEGYGELDVMGILKYLDEKK